MRTISRDSIAIVLTALVVATSASAARSPSTECQKVLEDAGATLVAKALRAQQDCLRRQVAGKLAPNVRCLVQSGGVGDVTDSRTLDALERSSARFRSAVARQCGTGVDLFAAAPNGIGFPSSCPAVTAACAARMDDFDDVLACLVCTHLATSRQLVTLARPSVPAKPVPGRCPTAAELTANAGSAGVLDIGWTGLSHGATLPSNGALTLGVQCSAEHAPCDTCELTGPIPNRNAGAGAIDAQRCSNDPAKKCDSDADCTNGSCESYLGAPIPLSGGGVGACVTSRVDGPVTGTVNAESGALAMTFVVRARVHAEASSTRPCPRCESDGAANDGVAGGTCDGGVRTGQPCDANGVSPIPTFGATSLDCPPGSFISESVLALNGSTGIEAQTLSTANPACTYPSGLGLKCFCPASGPQPTTPNACLDTTPGDEGLCHDGVPGSNSGRCLLLTEGFCGPVETFRPCVSSDQCAIAGDTCVTRNRPCYPDNGEIGASVVAVGHPDPPIDGVSNPTFAALFCIPPVASPAMNVASGLPGLGRLQLPLVMRQLP